VNALTIVGQGSRMNGNTYMECPSREMLESCLVSQKWCTSWAMARYVMGRQWGDVPWLRRSCAGTVIFERETCEE
jgi:hypothetical protein